MSGDEESSLVSDNSKNSFRDNSESVKYNKRNDASESELIRRRKKSKIWNKQWNLYYGPFYLK